MPEDMSATEPAPDETHDDTHDDAHDDTGQPDDNGAGVDDQDLVDRSKLDFDPDDGLYSGTAVDGTSDIPGPHEEGDDVTGDESAPDGGSADATNTPETD